MSSRPFIFQLFQVELLLDRICVHHPLQKVELIATNSAFTAAVVFTICIVPTKHVPTIVEIALTVSIDFVIANYVPHVVKG